MMVLRLLNLFSIFITESKRALNLKTLAVVVTHNRLELLRRCIQSLRNQTKPVDEILIINNDSSDGTETFLENENITFITQGNSGSSGGWNTGIQFALENKFDACWLMDDDGFPSKNAFEELCKNFKDEESCLSSVVLKENVTNEFVFPLPILNSALNPALFLFPRKIFSLKSNKLSGLAKYPFVHLFNGSLIRCSSIERIGNVNTNFFMMGDEVDFFYRLRNVGKVNSLLSAHHYHPDVTARPYSKTKIYYLIKNTIILHNKYFDKPLLRNIGLIPVILVRILRRNGLLFFLKALFFNGIIIRSLAAGIRGKIKKDNL